MDRIMHTSTPILRWTRHSGLMTALAGLVLLGASGCQSAGRIFYRPRAADAGAASYHLAANTTTAPAASTQPAATQPAATRPTTPRAVLYSAPRAEVRHAVLVALLADIPVTEGTYGAGREVAQTFTPGTAGTQITGRGGISAPQPVAVEAVNSRPGISNTVVALLPQTDPVNNVLNAGSNPASGPDGVCARLLQLGFPASALPCARRQGAGAILNTAKHLPTSFPCAQKHARWHR